MKKKKKMTLQRVGATFKSEDGELHKFTFLGWINKTEIVGTAGEYVMEIIKSHGYITDGQGLAYPLNQVEDTIEWKILEQRDFVSNADGRPLPKFIFYPNEMLYLVPWVN